MCIFFTVIPQSIVLLRKKKRELSQSGSVMKAEAKIYGEGYVIDRELLGSSFQVERTAHIKALGWEKAWAVCEVTKAWSN